MQALPQKGFCCWRKYFQPSTASPRSPSCEGTRARETRLIKLQYRTLPLKTRVICAIESLYYVFICTYFPARTQHEIDVVSKLNRHRNDVFKPFNIDFTLFARQDSAYCALFNIGIALIFKFKKPVFRFNRFLAYGLPVLILTKTAQAYVVLVWYGILYMVYGIMWFGMIWYGLFCYGYILES